MKETLKWGLLLLLMGTVMISCDDDDDYYSLNDIWLTIGNIEGDRSGYIIVTDGGKRLFPSANAVPHYSVEDGERLFVNFTILDEAEENEDIDYYVKVNNYREILTKGIIELNTNNADSIGNDPVWFNNVDDDVWIANHYLNVYFNYSGSPWVTHYINLVTDVDNPTDNDGVPVFEIRHNSNDDPYSHPPLRGFVSFDLKSLQVDDQDEVSFIVRATGPDDDYVIDKTFTYSYGESDEQVSLVATEMKEIKGTVL